MFPLQLCVTKLSGVGADAIFLGCLRPAPLDAHNLRAWVTPGGVILCTDPQFASLTGMTAAEMVGGWTYVLGASVVPCVGWSVAVLQTGAHSHSLSPLPQVGRPFTSLLSDMGGAEALLEEAKAAPYDTLLAGGLRREMHIAHRWAGGNWTLMVEHATLMVVLSCRSDYDHCTLCACTNPTNQQQYVSRQYQVRK